MSGISEFAGAILAGSKNLHLYRRFSEWRAIAEMTQFVCPDSSTTTGTIKGTPPAIMDISKGETTECSSERLGPASIRRDRTVAIGFAAVVRPAVITRYVVYGFEPFNPLVVPDVKLRNMGVGIVRGADENLN